MPARIDPEVAVAEMRAAGVEPLEPYPGANMRWRSKCATCAYEGTPRLTDVRRGVGACRACAGNAPVDPEVARRDFADAGVEMIGEFVNTLTPTLCRCFTCGYEGSPRLGAVRSGQGACRSCAGNAPVEPDTARQEFADAGVEMVGEFKGTMKPTRCRCLTCGYEGSPALSSIRQGNGACYRCSGKMLIDSGTARREFAAVGVEMIGEYLGITKPTRCRCLTCGNESSSRLNDIRSGDGACKVCAGKAPVDPDVARREFAEAGVTMIGEFTGVNRPTECRCLTCGNEGWPRLGNIRRGHGACRICFAGSFKSDQPGTLYLFRHDDHRALKVGITNQSTDRLVSHERSGWELVDLWFFDVGMEAHSIEQSALNRWKAYDHAVAADDMPQSGYTETVSLDDVTEAEAVALIEDLIAAANE